MPHLNVEISEDAMRKAKVAAAAAGVALRHWIDSLIIDATQPTKEPTKGERVYAPLED